MVHAEQGMEMLAELQAEQAEADRVQRTAELSEQALALALSIRDVEGKGEMLRAELEQLRSSEQLAGAK